MNFQGEDMNILNWIARWFLWSYIVSCGLEEAADWHASSVAIACPLALAPSAALLIVCAWYTIAGVVLWYLAVGIAFHFLLPNTNCGPWHKRGAW